MVSVHDPLRGLRMFIVLLSFSQRGSWIRNWKRQSMGEGRWYMDDSIRKIRYRNMEDTYRAGIITSRNFPETEMFKEYVKREVPGTNI